MNGKPDHIYVGVYDGHSGAKVSKFLGACMVYACLCAPLCVQARSHVAIVRGTDAAALCVYTKQASSYTIAWLP